MRTIGYKNVFDPFGTGLMSAAPNEVVLRFPFTHIPSHFADDRLP
jgi:hypothetical protein